MTVPAATAIIKDEHFAITAVTYSLRWLARQIRDYGAAPDLRLLHAMLDYIVEYPECLHHPKEDDLHKVLHQRSADAHSIIAELEAEHVRGWQLVEGLKSSLLRYEQTGQFDPFVNTVEDYTTFIWQHMYKEEAILLPLAEEVLTQEDWEQIDRAFRENDNPLFGIKPKEQSELLFQKILNLAPAPIGLGPAMPP